MIPKECKRLAEVDFPIAVVGAHSLAEKARRMGTPHQLHLWWAWRPLAACRSMLMALLLPDPCDPLCPPAFKNAARRILLEFSGRPSRWDRDLDPKQGDKADAALRHAVLHEFIADFANWDNAANPSYLKTARGLVKAAHGDEVPLVVDPFAGGGSIPIEAARVGCEAFASDLNPVACLILQAKLRDIPLAGPEIAEHLRESAGRVRSQAAHELSAYYPNEADGAKPIAYLWARTVTCEQPNCGCEIPLIRSFRLSKKRGRERALRYTLVSPKGRKPELTFEVFCPANRDDVLDATVTRARATCPACQRALVADRVRAQLRDQHGGADVVFDEHGKRVGGARLLCVVTVRDSESGRTYRNPCEADYRAAWEAQSRLRQMSGQQLHSGISLIPDEPTPKGGGSGAGRAFAVQQYGISTWRYLFSARQTLALATLCKLATSIKDDNPARDLVAMSIAKLAERLNTSCDWMVDVECPGHLFTQQAIQTGWDYAEANPLSASSGSYKLVVQNTANNIAGTYIDTPVMPQVLLGDAASSLLPEESASIWFTDPPYYDAIPYSDLSDFFFVWLKRALGPHPLLRNPFEPDNPLTPKCPEIVEDEGKRLPDGREKGRDFFERRLTLAFQHGRATLRPDGVGCVVFAHKTTEGWEAMLGGMIQGGWFITASWPIATERSARTRARESAALASSVHLVCRRRDEDAGIGDWGDVLRELPRRVGDWMERLQGEGIRGADLVFACIGPALEIFSRYQKVETADGREVRLPAFLEKVWEVVGRTALEQVLGTSEAKARNGAAGAVEEDARLTALFLWTLQSTNGSDQNRDREGAKNDDAADDDDNDTAEDARATRKAKGFSLVFDVVRRFAQPLGIDLPKWEGRVIETKKGVVRLMAVSERAEQLFGEDGADAVADWIVHDPQKNLQQVLFPELEAERAPKIRGRKKGRMMRDLPTETAAQAGATTLDRVHASMLLQMGGQANALRQLIKAEQERGPDFLRLANALSALYPKGSEEKRLLDAMLLAVPR